MGEATLVSAPACSANDSESNCGRRTGKQLPENTATGLTVSSSCQAQQQTFLTTRLPTQLLEVMGRVEHECLRIFVPHVQQSYNW